MTDWFAAGAGVGIAFGGPQGGLSGRFRLGRFETAKKAEAIDLVTAVSIGNYNSSIMRSWCDDSGCWEALGLWAQGGFDYELLADHFHLATGFGVAVMTTRLDTTILSGVQGVAQKPGNPVVLVLHVTVGVAL